MKSKRLILLSILLPLIGWSESEEDSNSKYRAETARAFAQQDAADVVAYYHHNGIFIDRPKREKPFPSEVALFEYLQALPAPKKLLVIILGKGHTFPDKQQTLDGFFEACRKMGFDQTVIQQARGNSRPILRE